LRLILELLEVVADAIDQAEHPGFEISHVAFKSFNSNLVGAYESGRLLIQLFLNNYSLHNGSLHRLLLGSSCSGGLSGFDLSHQLSFDFVKLGQEIHSSDLAFQALQ